MKKALITGITGQDGSYLAEFLIEKGYEVHGIIRRSSSFKTGRIDHLYRDPYVNNRKMILHYGDLTDSSNLSRLIEKIVTGENHSVREFTGLAFQEVGIEITWEGKNQHEIGRDRNNGSILVKVDPNYFRPTEVDILLGNPQKAKQQLNWQSKQS